MSCIATKYYLIRGENELVDSILMQLDRPDPEIDRIWADEARKRWEAYKTGKLEAVPYDQVMDKYRTK